MGEGYGVAEMIRDTQWLRLLLLEREAQAESARAAIARPDWWSRSAGPLLVLAHGVRLVRARGSRSELGADCTALAESAHARALATLAGGGRTQ